MINWKEVAVIALMTFLLVGGWLMFTGVDEAEKTAQRTMVTEAVYNAALTCYAVEGAYPLSLDYLREHYGLTYDENRYRVFYDAFSSNLFPTISVMEI